MPFVLEHQSSSNLCHRSNEISQWFWYSYVFLTIADKIQFDLWCLSHLFFWSSQHLWESHRSDYRSFSLWLWAYNLLSQNNDNDWALIGRVNSIVGFWIHSQIYTHFCRSEPFVAFPIFIWAINLIALVSLVFSCRDSLCTYQKCIIKAIIIRSISFLCKAYSSRKCNLYCMGDLVCDFLPTRSTCKYYCLEMSLSIFDLKLINYISKPCICIHLYVANKFSIILSLIDFVEMRLSSL